MTDTSADVLAIGNTIAAYSLAGDRHDVQELARCFTEDGVLEAPTQTLRGRAEIVRGLSQSRERWRSSFVRHHITTTWIDVTGPDDAVGRVYFFVVSEDGFDRGGIYSDEYRRVEGRWLIRIRLVTLDYVRKDTRLLQPPDREPGPTPPLPGSPDQPK